MTVLTIPILVDSRVKPGMLHLVAVNVAEFIFRTATRPITPPPEAMEGSGYQRPPVTLVAESMSSFKISGATISV